MKKTGLILLLIFLAAGAFMLLAPTPVLEAEAMGTLISVRGEHGREAVAEVKRLERLLSSFDPSSEVSRINALAGIAPVKVSGKTLQIVLRSIDYSRLSGGAFDITLGRKGSFRDIVVDKSKKTVFLKNHGMKIDLGGIGKGFAIESARQLLVAKGVKKALINMRSSITAIGGPWRIGISDPTSESRALGVVVLNNGEALSTSGQYEQPGHILDPRTGRKADQCLSVTIICRDAGAADALSTAVFVLGPEKGMALLRRLNAGGIIVAKSGKMVRNTELL